MVKIENTFTDAYSRPISATLSWTEHHDMVEINVVVFFVWEFNNFHQLFCLYL